MKPPPVRQEGFPQGAALLAFERLRGGPGGVGVDQANGVIVNMAGDGLYFFANILLTNMPLFHKNRSEQVGETSILVDWQIHVSV